MPNLTVSHSVRDCAICPESRTVRDGVPRGCDVRVSRVRGTRGNTSAFPERCVCMGVAVRDRGQRCIVIEYNVRIPEERGFGLTRSRVG